MILGYGKGDSFLFEPGSGKDIVYNFHTGATDSDVARIGDYGFTSLADVTKAMTQTGADVLLKLSSNDLILFKNRTIAAFTAENFELAIDPSKLKLTFADEFNALSLQTRSAGGGIWTTSYTWSAPPRRRTRSPASRRSMSTRISPGPARRRWGSIRSRSPTAC